MVEVVGAATNGERLFKWLLQRPDIVPWISFYPVNGLTAIKHFPNRFLGPGYDVRDAETFRQAMAAGPEF
jgi:hypothetical protein